MLVGMRDSEGSAVHDWNVHWTRYADGVRQNPANSYRRKLVRELLADTAGQERILDIGSGQGDLALALAAEFPDAEVRGIEFSQTGVDLARDAAKSLNISARFEQRDLLSTTAVPVEQAGWATTAICSEVLEHIDRPEVLLRNATDYLASGCRVIVTVPGGPRTAFDRHIGHLRHFTPASLNAVLSAVGFEVVSIRRAGFPFFNLYRTAVLLRGKRLISDFNSGAANSGRLSSILLRFFDLSFRWNLDSSPLGWQLVALAKTPEA